MGQIEKSNIREKTCSYSISVVIPVFNRSQLLKKTLYAFSQQTLSCDQFEIIVVDDGSTEDLRTLVNRVKAKTELNLKYLRQESAGPAVARTLGATSAKCSYIALIDSDMIPSKGWLERGLYRLRLSGKIGAVEGKTVIPDKEKITPFTHQTENLFGGKYLTCNLFLRKDLCRLYDCYRSSTIKKNEKGFPFREDSDLAFSILLRGFEIPFAEDAVAYHPTQSARWITPCKLAWRYQFDAILKRRFPKLYSSKIDFHRIGHFTIPHLRKKIYGFFLFMLMLPGVLLMVDHSYSTELAMFVGMPLLCFAFGINYYLQVYSCSPRATGVLGYVWSIPITLMIPFVMYASLIKGYWKFRNVKPYKMDNDLH
jgi:glycosyltransferase involved in cell wall biosynthesis